MWRYRWWAAGITWLVAVVGWVYVFSIPNVYEASARVYVDTNSLLKPLMQGLTAQQNTMNEVQLVSTAVLSRPNLESVAHETGLDLRAATPQAFEELVTRLQSSIRVMGGRDNIFTIRYQDTSRGMARDVVAAVLDTFVSDAIGAQGNDAEITERALAGEIREHEQRLIAAEATLADFKKTNIGYMPGETGDYYTRLQTALGAVSRTEERIRQLQQRNDELTRQIDGEEPVFGIMPTSNVTSCSQGAQIQALRGSLASLLVEFTEKHPRVVTLEETIATLEQRCSAEVAAIAAAGGPRIASPSDSLEMNPVYQNLRIQRSNAELELAEARGQLRADEAAVAALRRDVDKIGQVETQLKQLNRDYGVIQSRHQELLRRWEDLQAKKRLDPVTDNVQFRRIEPPFALADPVGPNRQLLLGAVLTFALGAGALVPFGLNLLYPACFTRRSVRRVTGLPVLGTVSMLSTPGELARRRIAAVSWGAAYVLLIVVTVVAIDYPNALPGILRALSGGTAT